MDLKAYLKSGPLDVEYVSHNGPVNKVSKTTNKPYTAFIYNFRLRSTGETFEQMLFDSDHRRIGYVGPNALIRITANEKGYPAYTVLPTGEASMNVPQPKNTAQVATERRITQEVRNDDEKWAKKDIAQTLGMLTKLFYDSDELKEFEMGTRFDKALELAGKNRTKFTKKINDCYMEDALGINQEPKFADEPAPRDTSGLPF